jgi:hypothetical protein
MEYLRKRNDINWLPILKFSVRSSRYNWKHESQGTRVGGSIQNPDKLSYITQTFGGAVKDRHQAYESPKLWFPSYYCYLRTYVGFNG